MPRFNVFVTACHVLTWIGEYSGAHGHVRCGHSCRAPVVRPDVRPQLYQIAAPGHPARESMASDRPPWPGESPATSGYAAAASGAVGWASTIVGAAATGR